MSAITRVEKLFHNGQYAPSGAYRINSNPSDHPAAGMTVAVSMGDGAYSTIINPVRDGEGPEWVMRYGAPESIRYTVASLLETYDYLLSGGINMKEATRRLRILRAVRAELSKAEGIRS